MTNLWFPGLRYSTPVIISQHSVQHGRDKVLQHDVGVVGPVNPTADQLQRLFLHHAHALDQRLFGYLEKIRSL